jgi:hypothetical protein
LLQAGQLLQPRVRDPGVVEAQRLQLFQAGQLLQPRARDRGALEV